MSEKEKAQELYSKFYSISIINSNKKFHNHIGDILKNSAKNMKDESNHIKMCVIKCIEEIISACEYNMVETYNTEWWNRVIEEVKNLPA